MATVTRLRVLYVDDDEAMRSLVADTLGDWGLTVELARDGAQALEQVLASRPDVIVTDLRMPGGGPAYLDQLRRAAPATPILLVTAAADADVARQTEALGFSARLHKPVRMSALAAALRAAVGLAAVPTSSF